MPYRRVRTVPLAQRSAATPIRKRETDARVRRRAERAPGRPPRACASRTWLAERKALLRRVEPVQRGLHLPRRRL